MGLVIAFGFLQGIDGIGRPGTRAQSVSQLGVEHVDYCLGRGDSGESANLQRAVLRRESLPGKVQGLTNSSQFRADDTDYLSSNQRYDWCAGYALY